MNALLALLERTLGSNWRDVVAYLVDANPESQIARAIEHRDFANALVSVDKAAERFAVDEQAAYVKAGQASAKWLDAQVPDLVRFDTASPIVAKWANENRMDLIREISTDQRDMIRTVISAGVKAGENPIAISRDLRASIGLTEAQAKIVSNYRTSLEQGQYAAALQRELSSGVSDRVIANAVRNQTQLTQPQIDTAVARYRANMLVLRTETIARTESLRIAHAASDDAIKMAVERGDVAGHRIKRKWNHTSAGKNPRHFHATMNGQTRGIGEAFVSGLGNELRYPGDPKAPAKETLNCRCAVSTRLAAG